MASMICKECGEHFSESQTKAPGSRWIELCLWLLLIVPGLVYSIWRRSAAREVCPACESPNIIPMESPIGRRLVAEYHPEVAGQITRANKGYGIGLALGRLFRRAQ